MAYVNCECSECGVPSLCQIVIGEFGEEPICNSCMDSDNDSNMCDDNGDMGIEDDIDPEFPYDEVDEYTEWQDVYGGDDWDHGQFDDGDF